MLFIYTDGGLTHQFKYFIFTDIQGKIIGHKLFVAQTKDFPPEEEAVIAAVYWARLYDRHATIITDCKSIMNLLYAEIRARHTRGWITSRLLRKLTRDTSINVTWLPREKNEAGKVLEGLLTFKPLTAEKILQYFNSLKRAA